jgi:hypothetical protein
MRGRLHRRKEEERSGTVPRSLGEQHNTRRRNRQHEGVRKNRNRPTTATKSLWNLFDLSRRQVVEQKGGDAHKKTWAVYAADRKGRKSSQPFCMTNVHAAELARRTVNTAATLRHGCCCCFLSAIHVRTEGVVAIFPVIFVFFSLTFVTCNRWP